MAPSEQRGQVQYINPEGMHQNPAFTNVVAVTGSVKTVYVGGQDAVDATGAIVGKGDIRAQTERIYANLKTALAAAGAGLEHVVRWNVYVVQGQPIGPAFEVFQRERGGPPTPWPSPWSTCTPSPTPTSWRRWMPSPSSPSRSTIRFKIWIVGESRDDQSNLAWLDQP